MAALSPNGRGMEYYGPYLVKLNLDLIKNRLSLFEENPFYFCKKNNIISGTTVSAGHRCTWKNRGSLAVAKLESKVSADMSEEAIENALMEQRGNFADCDFIEAHIFGSIHVQCIESVSGPVPTDPADKLIWDLVKLRLSDLGAEVEEYS